MIPTSFNFGNAIEPDYIVKCSYGNDSIALIQWLHEYNQIHPLGKVVVLYNDTGWGASWWPGRVLNGEKLASKYGFIPCQTKAKQTWFEMIRKKSMWPEHQARFCTSILKILPTIQWMTEHDPKGKSETVCGVRREESRERATWPEWVEASEANQGRPQWSPLYAHTTEERDALIIRAGWKPLPHRSRECRCVLAKASDIVSWDEKDIAEIERVEMELGKTVPGTHKFMFTPQKKKGEPMGIREVVKWAKRVEGTEDDTFSGCDSGYCTG